MKKVKVMIAHHYETIVYVNDEVDIYSEVFEEQILEKLRNDELDLVLTDSQFINAEEV